MPYGVRLLEACCGLAEPDRAPDAQPAAAEVLEHEMDRRVDLDHFHWPPSGQPPPNGPGALRSTWISGRHCPSGSFLTAGMVVCPCSMGTVPPSPTAVAKPHPPRRDVHLKERPPLILVPRETPLHAVQLRNLAACAEVGAVVCPPCPLFTRPQTLERCRGFHRRAILRSTRRRAQLLRRWGRMRLVPANQGQN